VCDTIPHLCRGNDEFAKLVGLAVTLKSRGTILKGMGKLETAGNVSPPSNSIRTPLPEGDQTSRMIQFESDA
jgi:hypothetical protein